MKRVTTILMLVAIVVMSSCSRQDDLPQTSGDVVKVTLRAQSPEAQTRAASDIKRYIIEVYEGGDVTTPANIFADGSGGITHHSEQPGGSFEMDLKKNTKYTFLLWADNSAPNDNENGFYKAGSLKAVEMNESATTRAEAFYGASTQTVTSTSSLLPVTLRHAVAKLVYNNTYKMIEESNTLKVVYPYTATFNVADGAIATTETTVTRTFDVGTGAVGELATDYLFAPTTEAQLATLSIAINTETGRDLTNVPVQANYVTNIKGEFSGLTNKDFNISASDDWEGENEIVSFAYPATNTVHLGKAGTLTNELIALAIGDGKDLKITGTMADVDFYTLRKWATNGDTDGFADLLHTLDLSGVTGLTAIPKNAFFSGTLGISSLTTVTLPSSVITIGVSAFRNNRGLTSINLPNVTTINNNAFTGCLALTSISLPSATRIDAEAFVGTGLTSVTFGTPITSWDKAVFGSKSSNNIDLTLKRGQQQPVEGNPLDANCTGDEVTAGEGAIFAEYTFKSITLVD